MTRVVIRRVSRVANYRAFQRWSDQGRPVDFQRVNVIYGTNGSGKSTLASLMRECAELHLPTPSAGLRLETDDGSTRATVDQGDSSFWSRVKVFNADYVEDNLGFNDANGPSPDSLLTLGKPNLDAQKELADSEAALTELEPKITPARNDATTARRYLEDRLTAVAASIVGDLRNSSVAKYRATNTYTKAQVRQVLVGDASWVNSASDDVGADITLSTSSAKPTPHLIGRGSISGGEDVESARELLSRSVVSQVIDSLRGHGDRSRWVQAGIPLHKDLEECLFCGQPLTAHRKELLEAHFDDSVVTLQGEIDALHRRLIDSQEASKSFRDQIPADGDLYGDLAGRLRSARLNYRAEHDDYMKQIAALCDLLQQKRENPFQAPMLAVDFELKVPSVAEVEAIVVTHRERSASHEKDAGAAARRVELARVREFKDEYDQRSADATEKEGLVARLEAEQRDLRQKVIGFQNATADPVPNADELTQSVARLLGRSDLVFMTTDDGKKYRIERGGHPATHLSEGERTAIALLHFLVSVREGVVVGDEPIVFIDDPVSSLDESILFGASSYLWAELVGKTFVSQVFLLTHNFELFRQWLIQLEGARKHMPEGFTIHEIRMRHQTDSRGGFTRVPQLDPWTTDAKRSKKLRSQYHYLFSHVATAVVEAAPELKLAERMDLLALAPNAARKMMEAFLSFRYPEHIGDFHGGMRSALTGVQDQSTRTHVERYLHAYSHNEEGNVSAMIDPSEATVVLRSLFYLMKEVDESHFSSMCRALMVDESAVLSA